MRQGVDPRFPQQLRPSGEYYQPPLQPMLETAQPQVFCFKSAIAIYTNTTRTSKA